MGVIYFDGVPTSDYDIVVEHFPDYEIAERSYETTTIPGRNGALIYDGGVYSNVERSYDIASATYDGNFRTASANIIRWLHGVLGYARLEDTYEPDIYRMAYFKGGVTIENILNWAGRLTITFDCKPQRFFKVGDDPFEISVSTDPSTISKVLDGDGNYVVTAIGGRKDMTSIAQPSGKENESPTFSYTGYCTSSETGAYINSVSEYTSNGFKYTRTENMPYAHSHTGLIYRFAQGSRYTYTPYHFIGGHKYFVLTQWWISYPTGKDPAHIYIGAGVNYGSRMRNEDYKAISNWHDSNQDFVSDPNSTQRLYKDIFEAKEDGDGCLILATKIDWGNIPEDDRWRSTDSVFYVFFQPWIFDLTEAYGAGNEPNAEFMYTSIMNGSMPVIWNWNQKFMDTSRYDTDIKASATLTAFSFVINNPTGQPAKPLIKIEGQGDVRLMVNDCWVNVAGLEDYVYIDSDLMESYKGNINYGPSVYFSNYNFPELQPGDNFISYLHNEGATTNYISKIEVTPRWWVL